MSTVCWNCGMKMEDGALSSAAADGIFCSPSCADCWEETGTLVVLNEQHRLTEEQSELLREQFGCFQLLSIPAEGWTISEMRDVMKVAFRKERAVVFASPISFMLGRLTAACQENIVLERFDIEPSEPRVEGVWLLHNDVRDKKELPNRKVIFTVASTGWQLVEVTGED